MKRTRKNIKHVRPSTKSTRFASVNGHASEIKNGHTRMADTRLLARADLISRYEIEALEQSWRHNPRWQGITRTYSAEKVLRLRGTMKIEHTIADRMSRKLWDLLHTRPYVHALGALTGNQAVQMAQAGLEAIYLSGWQVAADANLSATMYPDQSLYPSNSVPMVARRINKALQRADQIQSLRGDDKVDFWTPIVADAEAGFGGPL